MAWRCRCFLSSSLSADIHCLSEHCHASPRLAYSVSVSDRSRRPSAWPTREPQSARSSQRLFQSLFFRRDLPQTACVLLLALAIAFFYVWSVELTNAYGAVYLGVVMTVARPFMWLNLLRVVPARVAASGQYPQPVVGIIAASVMFGGQSRGRSSVTHCCTDARSH